MCGECTATVSNDFDATHLVTDDPTWNFALTRGKNSGGKHSSSVALLRSGQGECLIFLEQARCVPYLEDNGSIVSTLSCAGPAKLDGHPFVRAWAEARDASAQWRPVGQPAQWSARHCGAAPSWFSTKSLGFPIENHDQVTLRMELWDDNRLLGTSASKLSFLPAHETITQELDSAAELRDDEPCVLRFQVLDSSQVLAPRTVYFIRHAQSVWNQAQGKMNLYEMGRRTDHPLSYKGRTQAETLAGLLQEVGQDTSNLDFASLLQPDAIYSSPLIRAVQTAVISLRSVLSAGGRQTPIVLMPNAREKQNMGGFDTHSRKKGHDIARHVLTELRVLYQDLEEDVIQEAFSHLKLNTMEVGHDWWCEKAKESEEELAIRQQEFMSQLLYSPYRTIVVVGHSLFFQNIFKTFSGEIFHERRGPFAERLGKAKLNNCGVARVELDPRASLERPIVDVRLMRGTYLEGGQGMCACGHVPTHGEHEALVLVPEKVGEAN